MPVDPCVLPARLPADHVRQLGHPVLDRYLLFVASRCRPTTVLATVCALRAFFAVVAKEPHEVVVADVLDFIHEQRQPHGDGRMVRLADGEARLSSRTIMRRLSTVSVLFAWMVIMDQLATNPVPRGLATRRRPGRSNGVPLIRTPGLLPQGPDPAEVNALLAALRRWRDRAWSRRCCSVVCAAARCWACGWRICVPARVGSSSTRARAATSG